ncbi:MAG: DUF354 domain-containing protein [Syntrophales bacterium]|jgi:predicted glycosyltransferase|nr:DUF354 domain-containing protein [Syntrophales bacterium]MCK9528854.1 DUF354 domain-containing protein [Syntrophales bacterium]MDX9921052.1 DUF354 domain-containing protein [Syntrophales bacterium]
MPLNILFDISHPSYVHLYKNIISNLKKQNHSIVITAQAHNSITGLLSSYNLDYVLLGEKVDGIASKIINQVKLNRKMRSTLKKYNVDLAIGGSTTVAHGAVLTSTRSVIFTDDDGDVVPLFARSTYPFADKVIHPSCIRDRLGENKQVFVNSLKELAYLHPNHFEPDKMVLKYLGVNESERYFIVRFSALKAHHDYFAEGIKDKIKLIRFLEKYGRVFISSESEVDGYLKKYIIDAPVTAMHSIMACAHLYVGDSQTMASEAAVLATPSIRYNSFVGRLSYLDELEKKYQLTFGFTPGEFDKMLETIQRLLVQKDLKEQWHARRSKLLLDKIDLTDWFVNYINSKKWIL